MDSRDWHPAAEHPLVSQILGSNASPEALAGFHTRHTLMTEDGTWSLLNELPGFNGNRQAAFF